MAVNRIELAVGLIVFALAAVYYWMATQLPPGFIVDPVGPGYYPKLLASGVGILAVLMIVLAFVRRQAPKTAPSDAPSVTASQASAPQPPWLGTFRTWAMVVLPAVYMLLIPYLGYMITTPLFVAAVMVVLGERRWRAIVTPAIGLMVALYILFILVLSVPLGRGVFDMYELVYSMLP